MVAKKGQIIAASFVEAPRQRHTRQQNAEIRAGNIPEEFDNNKNVKRQKLVDAWWAIKNEEAHFDHKNHISIDNENKLIREFQVTSAEVHDAQVLKHIRPENRSNAVFVDSAYRSEEQEIELAASVFKSRINISTPKTSKIDWFNHPQSIKIVRS